MNNKYIITDKNFLLNEKSIVWIKLMDECLEVCVKANGCYQNGEDTHKICKNNNPLSYLKLNREKIIQQTEITKDIDFLSSIKIKYSKIMQNLINK